MTTANDLSRLTAKAAAFIGGTKQLFIGGEWRAPERDETLPVIDDSTIGSYLARADKFPADGYIYSDYDKALFDKLLAK